jgi:hypothetical protein
MVCLLFSPVTNHENFTSRERETKKKWKEKHFLSGICLSKRKIFAKKFINKKREAEKLNGRADFVDAQHNFNAHYEN